MNKIIKPLFALSALTLAMQAGAAGFALNETSASAAGTAYAGRGSNAEDASIMASNPAGIALLERAQVTGGLGYVLPKGEFEDSNGANKQDDFLKSAVIPFGYYAAPINDQLSWGLGIYAPFGATSDYDTDWTGRYMANKTVVEVVNIQPTIAYKFNDQLSFGASVFGSFAKGELTRSIDFSSASGTDGFSKMKGDDWGYGWSIGTIWQPTNKTSMGLSYRSKTKLTLKGDAEISNVPGALQQVLGLTSTITEKAKLGITLPENVELSLTHQLDDRWTVMAGANWTRWSRFKELVIVTDQDNGPISGTLGSAQGANNDPDVLTYVPENWKDVWAFSLGTSYKYSDALTLKAGYARDNSPVQDEYRTARIPDADRNWLTVGAKYEMAQDWTLDAAYGYMFTSKVTINEKGHNSNGTENGTTLTGEYKTTAHVVSMSVTKRF
ncbi:hypothetical protein ACH42_00605 [Endozoicomonas sp. (ex Bugula neritina AB1)]|nr:hypothetical protein ACH42_00605 [Endozoicomonas sp. (ex Bugula neritina AB1)]